MKQQPYFSVVEIKKKLERYCVYQERCHKEIAQKLKEFNLIEEAKNQLILHLLEHDFLNEERFSKSFASGKFRIKKWGKQRIIRELKLRDISEYNIKIALKEIDEEAYKQTIFEITAKKNGQLQESNFFKRKKKLTDFLYRKGYEYDLILATIQQVIEA
ncbi:MAG: RecX family transcriptional regulator [Flavobacteriaceae bacterium]|nr:RecX family transcriptional regulator [Flavobacteriaceae bacterium]